MSKHKAMDGILLFDKPAGWTSHNAVDFMRRRLGQRAVGHAGTLDPMATGLLVMLLGKATKRSAEFSGLGKGYEGTMTLGVVTDTLDKEGAVLARNSCEAVTEESLRTAYRSLTGTIQQVPPSFSAIKKNGKKLYELARAGVMVQAEAREVKVEEFTLLDYQAPLARFRVHCSKGTYVRSLCESVGKILGCGAMLSELKRTSIGAMNLEKALSQEAITKMTTAQIQNSLAGQ